MPLAVYRALVHVPRYQDGQRRVCRGYPAHQHCGIVLTIIGLLHQKAPRVSDVRQNMQLFASPAIVRTPVLARRIVAVVLAAFHGLAWVLAKRELPRL